MERIEIPGYGTLELRYIVLDYNGTIAADGKIPEKVQEYLRELSEKYEIYVLTADTHGDAAMQCQGLPLKIRTFPNGSAMDAKREIVRELGGAHTICFGNGRNDCRMFEEAVLSVAVIDAEGAYTGLLSCADFVVRSIEDGLDLLRFPKRMIAGMRG